MLKVIIAEDEQWIRKSIVKCVEWERLDLELVAEASDGNKALERVRCLNPDIILIDIHMPGFNGLQLMEHWAAEGFKPKFIIISGYNNFEYAQKAISFGAFAYLLKPIKREEVNETLAKACQVIHMEREMRTNLEQVKKQLNVGIPLIKERIMFDYLSGRDNSTSHQDIAYSPYYAVLVLGFDNYLKINVNRENIKQDIKGTLAIIEAILMKCDEGIVFEREENRIVVILGLKSDREPIHLALAKRILSEIRSTAYSVTIGAGNIHSHVSQIKQSYNEALKAYREKLIIGGDKIITPLTVASGQFAVPEDHIKSTCMAVELSDIKGIRLGVQVVLSSIVNLGPICYDTVAKLVSRLLDATVELALRYGIQEKFYEERDLEYLEGIDSLTDYLISILITITGKISSAKENKGLKAISAALEFIQSHYTKDISLEMLASHVSLNPNYLSEMFKKETGSNYTDYVVSLRIKKAQALMQENPWLSINKIAELVGYGNTRYFSTLFHKKTGYRPSEFKQLVSNSTTNVAEEEFDE
ncbi:response regulator [Paenibacillus sp. FSL H7-0331]|uniref:response regulator n=1 Tax=Paenibacillus sp. FSL H7-0331 TaxID=1920421 RepID=UPI00096C06F9|nr:response regulator [Paenibacillus sp. FSL H7-0331]OMF14111.1 hypothetical protein BK127_19465 [Paenibacillus sp. FSL H7-0331]